MAKQGVSVDLAAEVQGRDDGIVNEDPSLFDVEPAPATPRVTGTCANCADQQRARISADRKAAEACAAAQKRNEEIARMRDENGALRAQVRTILGDDDEVLDEAASLAKLDSACAGCTTDDACCAIVGAKAAGWGVNREETETGFVIRFVRPRR